MRIAYCLLMIAVSVFVIEQLHVLGFDFAATGLCFVLLAWMIVLSLEIERVRARSKVSPDAFQQRVAAWMDECFDRSLYGNMTERGDRFLEEVLELLQSKGYDPSRVDTLVRYVYSRPIGEPSQEVGGVMVTLAGFCSVAGLDMAQAGIDELARITSPDVMQKIRRKQAAKNALHFDTPLPGNAGAIVAGVGED